jgi:iron complex outermembrane recepter protein
VQYTFKIGAWELIPRVDYSYQSRMFARNFNGINDRLKGFDLINAQITLNSPGGRYSVRGFITNIENDQAILGQFTSDPSTGVFTNAFTTDPRRYGIILSAKF